MRDRPSLTSPRAGGVALAAAVGLSACSGVRPEETPSRADEAFTGWTLPGVTLHRSCQQAGDRSSCGVWGTDDVSGARLSGAELFQRLPADTSADVLASRAQDLLLGRAGGTALTPELAASSRFVGEAERSVITAPRLEGEVLVFYVLEGEMRPTPVELRVDREGALSRRNVTEVWVAGAPRQRQAQLRAGRTLRLRRRLRARRARRPARWQRALPPPRRHAPNALPRARFRLARARRRGLHRGLSAACRGVRVQQHSHRLRAGRGACGPSATTGTPGLMLRLVPRCVSPSGDATAAPRRRAHSPAERRDLGASFTWHTPC